MVRARISRFAGRLSWRPNRRASHAQWPTGQCYAGCDQGGGTGRATSVPCARTRGASHDPTLKDLFTSGIAETLLRVDGLNAIFGSGVFKTEPLKLLIARYVDEDLLHLIASQHRRGRRLFIVTTNIDAQRTAVWNMGAIAASDYSGRLQLFRDILVASASAPGLFAPAYIQVQAGNAQFQEMHVDGAVTSNVLAVPESLLLQKVALTGGVAVALRIKGRSLFFNYGWADHANKRPITTDTLFNLASLRKVFEATLLAQAVRNGNLRLDDPVAKYVVELQQGGDIRQGP
jgi:predicted acylesterase/phospholipase RssA